MGTCYILGKCLRCFELDEMALNVPTEGPSRKEPDEDDLADVACSNAPKQYHNMTKHYQISIRTVFRAGTGGCAPLLQLHPEIDSVEVEYVESLSKCEFLSTSSRPMSISNLPPLTLHITYYIIISLSQSPAVSRFSLCFVLPRDDRHPPPARTPSTMLNNLFLNATIRTQSSAQLQQSANLRPSVPGNSFAPV